jgi:hypothetical protein
LPKLAGCGIRTTERFGFVGDGSLSIAGFRQLMSCIRRHGILKFATSHSAEFPRNWWTASDRSCSIAGNSTAFGLHSPPRPLAKLCCQSSAQRTEIPIASAPKLSYCRAINLPRICFRATRDSFAKRGFRLRN